MSFALQLQANTSDALCVTKNLTLVTEVNGVLKTDTSVTNPTFIIALHDTTLPTFNYISCPTFGRSYFVNDIKSVRGGLWEVSCNVDVLTSFAEEIKACTAIVKRQETQFNLYYNDGTFRCYQNPYIITKEFPHGFNTGATSFVLAVAGGITEDEA